MATSTDTAAGRPSEGQAELPIPGGRLGRRGLVYTLLKGAGAQGVTTRELAEAGIAMPHPHPHSLRCEGPAMGTLSGFDERRQRVDRHLLTRDAGEED